MSSTPLRLDGTGGDLKEMSTTEENYLAYLAGVRLSSMTAGSTAALTTNATGNATVGTYSNTVYDQAVGTHGTTLTTSTTNTTLYQTEGTASKTSNHRYAISFDSTQDHANEMTDAEMNT